MKATLENAFQRMYQRYGSQSWWPGDSQLEIIVGAVLTQNTNWKNVELAIDNLRQANVLSIVELLRIETKEMEKLIRPAGYYRVKTKRLRNVLRFIVSQFGSIEAMFRCELSTLRKQLLEVNGIGPETADAILLYAGGLPTFVIDAYTNRVAKRHGWIDKEASYDSLKELFETHLQDFRGTNGEYETATALFNEYHALLVNVGKDYCKPTPRCEDCPLCAMLPKNGPLN